METIYEDDNGKIFGRHTNTDSVILKVEYKDMLPQHITVPDSSLQNIEQFLNRCAIPKGHIRMLSEDYDLTKVDDTKLATILKELCTTYIMCRYEISTATLDVWGCIIRVSSEIVDRGD